MNNEVLNVWHDSNLVGHLWQDELGNIGFEYESTWIQSGFSISQQLPLKQKIYGSAERKAHLFFSNLLPEGNARSQIVRDLKIANSDFILLKSIGGECAGALSILPSDYSPDKSVRYKSLTKEDLKKIILRKGNVFNLAEKNHRPRLSLAGAQNKCPLYFDGNDYFLPEDAAPSSHILKFEIPEYRNILVYEYFMNKLAKQLKLPAVDCELKQNDDHCFLLVTRYDRIIQDQHIFRLHQEDFCQALGFYYEKKYQQEGGPSFEDCYKLIQGISTAPISDTENLLKWQIFNYLAGNSDGHAKNLALLYKDQHVQLAPFYDLVCTRAIERIDTKLAMSIGDGFNPNDISWKNWSQLAQKCDIREQYLKGLIKELAEQLFDAFGKAKNEFENEHGSYPALQRVQKVIFKQVKKI